MLTDIRLQKIFRNFNATETKIADGAPRTLVVKISTPTPDRSKDTVQPDGMDATNFLKNPVVLYAHNYSDLPIAKCTSLKGSNDGVMATVQFPDEGVYPKADIVYQMYKQGFLNAWSIGFMPTDFDENSVGGYNFKTWELFEFSSVPVPDNPEALTVMRSKGINVDELVTDKSEEELEKEAIEAVEAKEEEAKEDEPETEEPNEEAKLVDMTVAQLKEIFQFNDNGELKVEKKDINEVIVLSYILDELHYFIRAFQQAGVSQDSIDKLTQALSLVMEVTKMQATIGEKTIDLKDMTIKSGRAISSKHEEMLKGAMDHMNKSIEAVKGVLDTVAQDGKDDGKKVNVPITSKLYSQITAAKKQLKETDKQVGLTLRLIKTIESNK